MIEIILTVLFCVIAFKVLKLAFKISWGIAKIIAVVLFVLSIPALICGLIMAGGFVLLCPIVLILAAAGILLKARG